MKERRQGLRNNATPEEKLLWKQLQGSKLGFKFIRQFSVDSYVVDFYCPKKRLAIELDGGVHFSKSQQKYDAYRTSYLESFRIKVIRFRNLEVNTNMNNVLDKIKVLLSPS